jgi:large subunit ribosomal protein L21
MLGCATDDALAAIDPPARPPSGHAGTQGSRAVRNKDERESTVVYAVIRTGGKQYRVKVGDVLDVEKLIADDGADLSFEPILVVDDDGNVRSAAADLAGATVTATVMEQHRGKKIRIFTYKNKTGQQRHQGHRQSLTRLVVAGIDVGGKKPSAKADAKAAESAKKDGE